MNRTVFLSDLTSHSYGSRTPSAPAKEASRHFIDGAATPPNLGGEFRVAFRVHDHSRNEVQKLERPMRTSLLTTSEKMANLQTRAKARDYILGTMYVPNVVAGFSPRLLLSQVVDDLMRRNRSVQMMMLRSLHAAA